MDNLPIITLRIDYLKDTIMQSFISRNEGIEEMVKKSLDSILSVRNIEKEICEQVNTTITTAIKSLSKNIGVQDAITNIVIKSLEAYNEK